MKRKQGVEILNIAGDYMAIPNGSGMASLEGAAILNEVAAFLLNRMKTDISEEDLLEGLLKEYAVDRDTAMRDLREILDSFEELGFIDR